MTTIEHNEMVQAAKSLVIAVFLGLCMVLATAALGCGVYAFLREVVR